MQGLNANLKITLPVRKTPEWEVVKTVELNSREIVEKVMTGRLPIGVPSSFDLVTEEERKLLVSKIKTLQSKQYDNTDHTEQVFTRGGLPFVDFPTVESYIKARPDKEFEKLTQPLLDRYVFWFRKLGFQVEPLVDPVTSQPYHVKVCRHIAVSEDCFKADGNVCTVLHVDDIIRDGSKKTDFVVPIGVSGREYFQFSVCTLLENGGFRPDDLYVHEVVYTGEMEGEFNNSWRAPKHRIADARYLSYTPQLSETYMFSTLNYHDVRGGEAKSERLTFSVFFIYVPSTNTLYYYN